MIRMGGVREGEGPVEERVRVKNNAQWKEMEFKEGLKNVREQIKKSGGKRLRDFNDLV